MENSQEAIKRVLTELRIWIKEKYPKISFQCLESPAYIRGETTAFEIICEHIKEIANKEGIVLDGDENY